MYNQSLYDAGKSQLYCVNELAFDDISELMPQEGKYAALVELRILFADIIMQYLIYVSFHYNDVVMDSQITSLTFAYWAVYSGAGQRKHQNSASLAFVRGIHRRPVNFPHKWPVTRKMFPFSDVIISLCNSLAVIYEIGMASTVSDNRCKWRPSLSSHQSEKYPLDLEGVIIALPCFNIVIVEMMPLSFWSPLALSLLLSSWLSVYNLSVFISFLLSLSSFSLLYCHNWCHFYHSL